MNNNESIMHLDKHIMNLLLKFLLMQGKINNVTYSKIQKKHEREEVA